MDPRLAVRLAYLTSYAGAGVWVAYYPLYLAHRGMDPGAIGLVIGVQPALRWLGALAWAQVADRWRSRREVLIATSAGGTVVLALLLQEPATGPLLWELALLSLLHGAQIPLLDATVNDNLAELGGDYGRLRLWGSLGFLAGATGSAPLVALFSASVVPLLLFLPALGMVPAMRFVPASQHADVGRAPDRWRILSRPFVLFLLVALLLQISSGTWVGFFAVHTRALGLGPLVPGWTWGLAVLAEIGLLLWARPVLDRFVPTHLVGFALAATSLRWGLSALAVHPVAVVLLQLGHIFSFSLFHLAALSLLIRLVPRSASSTGQAVYGGIGFGVGGSAGLALSGLLVQHLGTHGAFAIDAMLAALALVPAWVLHRTLHGRPHPQGPPTLG